jgi:hypothetical protein
MPLLSLPRLAMPPHLLEVETWRLGWGLSKAGHHRWQAATCWHNKTGRQIFTKNAGPGSPIGVSNVKQKSDSIGRMVTWSFIARSHE